MREKRLIEFHSFPDCQCISCLTIRKTMKCQHYSNGQFVLTHCRTLRCFLVSPVPRGLSGDKKSPLAILPAPCQLTPISFRSYLKMVRPIFSPFSSSVLWHPVHCCMGCFFSLHWQDVASHFLLLAVTVSWSSSMPALLITSPFVA